MTVFKAALGLCGLSISDAAKFFGESESTVKHWSAGSAGRAVPDAAWAALAVLYDQIVEISEHTLDTFERDEITPEGVQEIAKREHGSTLPPAALEAVAAMFVLTRMMDDE